MAGSQSRYFIGRPGVNALRHDEMYELPPDLLNTVQMLADTTHINAWDDVYRREGYLPALPEGHVALGKHLMFREGEKVRRVSSANEQDMLRIERAIYEAQFQSDYIAVSIHSHEQPNTNKECPDDFLVEFCHRCIDAGADVVIGHRDLQGQADLLFSGRFYAAERKYPLWPRGYVSDVQPYL